VSDIDPDLLVQDGLAAWERSDFDAIERLLHPAVTLKALQPGPWDCDNREQVMSLLRLRQERQPRGETGGVEVLRLDDATFAVSGLAGGDEVATLVTIADGKVIALQQFLNVKPDPDADLAVAAVRSGDGDALAAVLTAHPDLAHARIPGYQGRTLLHIATDWPGYLPHGPQVVRLLIEHGADPNDRGGDDEHGETPLHWAASSDDVDVARALLDAGADPHAANGSIGTPLDNAIGYGCFAVAHLLAARGVAIDKLWHAAALGRLDRLEELLALNPEEEQISQAFWHACAASQRRAAERLLGAGADLDWVPHYADGTPLDAANGHPIRQQNIIDWLQEQGASTAHPDR
jgi:hypothetical protein